MNGTTPNGETAMNGGILKVDNYIGGNFLPPTSGKYMSVVNPANSHSIGEVGISVGRDVDDAVATAKAAFSSWSSLTMKARAAIVSESNTHEEENCFTSFYTDRGDKISSYYSDHTLLSVPYQRFQNYESLNLVSDFVYLFCVFSVS